MSISRWFVHTVTVETFQGTNGYGVDVFNAPVTVACFTDDSRKLVRNKAGDEVVSETTLLTDVASGALFPADSRVTIPNGTLPGRVTRVIKVNINDAPGLGLPDHAEVTLE